MQDIKDTEKKIRKCQSDEYKRKSLNINNISNMSNWSEDDWDELDEMYNSEDY